jgi:molybdopterin-binding protein
VRTNPQYPKGGPFEQAAFGAGEIIAEQHKRGEFAMKLSTRNVIKGKIIEVNEGTVAARVRVDIGGGNIITSTITVDAVRDLALKAGDEVHALIKASSVMIMKE